MTTEKRKNVLTEDDFDRIGNEFDKRLAASLESIGYNVTTAEARSEIVKDHTYVREWRTGIEKARLAGWILAFSSALVWIAKTLWAGFVIGAVKVPK